MSDHNELIVQFDTGGDDLRGGNDNIHLLLLLRVGRHYDLIMLTVPGVGATTPVR